MKALVTGGAGFIGSHLVDKLVALGSDVTVIDNLRSGKKENLTSHFGKKNFHFIQCDLIELNEFMGHFSDYDTVYHFAANPEVRVGFSDTNIDFNNNVIATRNVLEACKRSGKVKRLIFTSTSTIYGEASRIPTPENYGPTKPISMYGASKNACEALISGYSHLFGFQSIIFRMANVIGPRSNHGVIYDFLTKLLRNRHILEVLGNGKQSKSYLHVTDCIDAILYASEHSPNDSLCIYNVGSADKIDVLSIANTVIATAGLKDVKIVLSDTQGDGRGWKGDIKEMLLDISKLVSLGWQPQYNSKESVRITAENLVNNQAEFALLSSNNR
ncbi:NAD-dependent epimerase/dehydratase family protein [Candidatus Nitrososphaera sp. FF02]|uniref:NAD-dependent epimerase/dehydratase family protein n=1 Tax=Candidatus Nitrososphaera sp. FF02 TaxID=3398226 RepID=UPI0039ED29DC